MERPNHMSYILQIRVATNCENQKCGVQRQRVDRRMKAHIRKRKCGLIMEITCLGLIPALTGLTSSTYDCGKIILRGPERL